jgi:hypothetical protein
VRPISERAEGLDQLRDRSQRAAAADGADQHQGGRFRRQAEKMEQRGQILHGELQSPRSPQHINRRQQAQNGWENADNEAKSFLNALQQSAVYVHASAECKKSGSSDNQRNKKRNNRIHSHFLQSRLHTFAAAIPAETEMAERARRRENVKRAAARGCP